MCAFRDHTGRPKFCGITGIVDPNFGYGRGTIALLRAATQADLLVKVNAFESDLAEVHRDARRQMQLRRWIPEYEIAHITPPQLHTTNQISKVILYSMFELSQLPTRDDQGYGGDWVSQVNNRVSHVLVPTEYPKTVFENSGVKVPVTVLPYGHQFEGIEFKERQPSDVFTILCYGELLLRKGADLALRAFLRAFPKNREVRLVFKTYGGSSNIQIDDPRITVIDEVWSRNKIVEYLYTADCFLWLSRGEGFSLPPQEAIASGLPTVVAANTGMLDWITPDCFSVPCVERPSGSVGNWHEADIEIAANHLLEIYQNRQEAHERTLAANKAIREKYTMQKSADALLNFLDKRCQ